MFPMETIGLEAGVLRELGITQQFLASLIAEVGRSVRSVYAVLGGIATAIGFAALFGIDFKAGVIQVLVEQWRAWSKILWDAVLYYPSTLLGLDLGVIEAAGLTLSLTLLSLWFLARARRFPKVVEFSPIVTPHAVSIQNVTLWLDALIPAGDNPWRKAFSLKESSQSGKASKNLISMLIYAGKVSAALLISGMRSVFGALLFAVISYLVIWFWFGWETTRITVSVGWTLLLVVVATFFAVRRPRPLFAGMLVLGLAVGTDFVLSAFGNDVA